MQSLTAKNSGQIRGFDMRSSCWYVLLVFHPSVVKENQLRNAN